MRIDHASITALRMESFLIASAAGHVVAGSHAAPAAGGVATLSAFVMQMPASAAH